MSIIQDKKQNSEIKSIDDLKAAPYNPRRISDKAANGLKRSLEKFGDIGGITWNKRTGHLVTGHQRVNQLKRLGAKLENDCLVYDGKRFKINVVDWDDTQEKAANVAANNDAIGGAFENLGDVLRDIKLGIDKEDFNQLRFDLLDDIKKDETDSINDHFGESEITRLKDDVKFDGVGYYDFPLIRKDKAIPEIKDVSLFNKNEKQNGFTVWNYNSDGSLLVDFKKSITSFYVDDRRFEGVWKDPSKCITKLWNSGCRYAFTPNFSAYYNWPRALRIFNIFRSRWIARYMQEAGFEIAIDISGASDDDFVLDGIPNNFPLCVQIHRDKIDYSKQKSIVLNRYFELNPTVVYVYGQKEKLMWYPEFEKQNVILIEPYTIKRMHELNKKGYYNAE